MRHPKHATCLIELPQSMEKKSTKALLKIFKKKYYILWNNEAQKLGIIKGSEKAGGWFSL